ncbi:hypothetical protein CCACVL1_29722 [Corchorus capsularis]|uniref:Uncharacterized protein n=1 Tax=Corchorus capsularis TaxID=210143 RepID=A0A1R3G0E8_COCAP|nr:hypothetical protein CCACVL1_29722 [Corchorus capsularis]
MGKCDLGRFKADFKGIKVELRANG